MLNKTQVSSTALVGDCGGRVRTFDAHTAGEKDALGSVLGRWRTRLLAILLAASVGLVAPLVACSAGENNEAPAASQEAGEAEAETDGAEAAADDGSATDDEADDGDAESEAEAASDEELPDDQRTETGRPYVTVTDQEDPEEDEPARTATSSPRSLWRKGTMPFLYQIDPEWAEHSYCGGTVAVQGCGPTALNMVYIYLTGDDSIDPAGMADFSTENGYASDGSGTYWSLMSDGAAKLGLDSRSVTVSPDAMRAELEAGRPIICIMSPGHFTEIGHFIVVERMAREDGMVVVHDSNNLGRSMRTWSLELVCSEAQAAWSFSA